MTLILNCITQEYVFQVSDRRLVRLADGKPCKDDENKAVDFLGSMAFSYTGLAELPGPTAMPTDLWLADALAGSTTISEAIEALRMKATSCFQQIQTEDTRKRHAFVGVGWAQQSLFGPLLPVIALISNYHTDQGYELSFPCTEFGANLWFVDGLGEAGFELFTVGQIVDRNRGEALRRNVAHCLKHRNAGPQSILRLLVDTVRSEAKVNEKVGQDLLAVSIARSAVGSNYLIMPDGSVAHYSLSSLPAQGGRSFLYIPQGSSEGVTYGPNFVYGSTVLAGFFGAGGGDDMRVSARIMRLEQGAKSGVIMTDVGLGQFISPPRVNHPAEEAAAQRLVDEFMRALASGEAERAHALFSVKAREQVSLSSLRAWLTEQSGPLSRYCSVEVKSSEACSTADAGSHGAGDGVFVRVYGLVSYQGENGNYFDALLEQEGGEWRVFGMTVRKPASMRVTQAD